MAWGLKPLSSWISGVRSTFLLPPETAGRAATWGQGLPQARALHHLTALLRGRHGPAEVRG